MPSDQPQSRKRGRKVSKRQPMSRSENMSRIRSKNTKPELRVRRTLWAAGLRYRLHENDLPGKPDLVFPGRRTVVFVHGCFFHAHEDCKNFRLPKTRAEWWEAKLARNKARDDEVRAALEADGWRVIVVWECETESEENLRALVRQLNLPLDLL